MVEGQCGVLTFEFMLNGICEKIEHQFPTEDNTIICAIDFYAARNCFPIKAYSKLR